MKSAPYVIVSPLCDESHNVDALVDSVAAQSALPTRWVIVDDGSRDSTWVQLQARCAGLNWVSLLRRPCKGYVGLSRGEELTAMREAVSTLKQTEYEFIAKLDGDVNLEPSYFEALLHRCSSDTSLGIVSGSCWETQRGKEILIRAIGGSAWPPGRLYRKECFEAVSEGEAVLGWDMLHVIRAVSLGWKVQAYLTPRFLHRRRMGSRGGSLRGKVRYGRTSYLLGYSPAYFACRLVYQAAKYPPLIGSLAMAFGYLRSLCTRDQVIVTDEEKRVFRSMQYDALARAFSGQCGLVKGHVAVQKDGEVGDYG